MSYSYTSDKFNRRVKNLWQTNLPGRQIHHSLGRGAPPVGPGRLLRTPALQSAIDRLQCNWPVGAVGMRRWAEGSLPPTWCCSSPLNRLVAGSRVKEKDGKRIVVFGCLQIDFKLLRGAEEREPMLVV